MTKEKTEKIIKELSKVYPNARPLLIYSSAYELLIAVMLSAQCTDKRVNKVTAELFKKYNTPDKMLTLSVNELEKYIFTCGLYHSKAVHILSASKDIIEKFSGKVPDNIEDLQKLSGVGKKTANVVASVWFGVDAIAVDTHVFRVTRRIGLAKGKNVEQVEKELQKNINKNEWSKAHHYLIFHGRNVCKAIHPNCDTCAINSLCEKHGLKETIEDKK